MYLPSAEAQIVLRALNDTKSSFAAVTLELGAAAIEKAPETNIIKCAEMTPHLRLPLVQWTHSVF